MINRNLIIYHLLITLNGLCLGVFIMERDFLLILSSLAVFLILLLNDSRITKTYNIMDKTQ